MLSVKFIFLAKIPNIGRWTSIYKWRWRIFDNDIKYDSNGDKKYMYFNIL